MNDPVTYNASAVTALTQLPSWLLAVVVVAVVAQLVVHAGATRGAPVRVRVALLLLRALLSMTLLLLLFEPGRKFMQTKSEPNRVVVALDTSASMQTLDAGASLTRMQQAARAAQRLLEQLRAHSAMYVPEVLAFDDVTRSVSDVELAAYAAGTQKAEGTASKLAVALSAIAAHDGPERRPYGGMVLVSDGADSSGLSTALNAALLADVKRLDGPLHTVAVGDGARFKDIALVRAVADEFAFVRNKLNIDVLVRQQGFAGQALTLTLKEDGRAVATTEVQLSDAAETKATFAFEPQRAGKRVYTVSAPVFADESIVDNNRVDFSLKLIRDRIRVLQVSGRPSWDERFVRRLLKENPSVDLISFFILRSTTDSANAANRELSLIPFPTRELFTEELATFDVVIFQDFNYAPYQMGMYLDNVKRFVVESGGGFLMIGGELSFSEGGYDTTPIADILPVRLLPGTGHLNTDAFTPVVTEAGASHPITDLGALGDTFAALPPLQGLNVTAGLVPGAEALLAHPFINGTQGPAPVVAVSEVGKGRSMAVMTDTTWRWALPHVGAGGRGDAHRRFYASALRWLIRDPELSRTKIVLDTHGEHHDVQPGAAVAVEVRTYNPKYQPEAGDAVNASFEPLDVAPAAAPADSIAAAASYQQTGTTDTDGVWRSRFVPTTTGVWRVRATATRDGAAIGADEDVFIVGASSTEQLYLQPRADILAALSAAGSASFAAVPSASIAPNDVDTLTFVDRKVQRVLRQKTEPVWNRWWALALLVSVAGAEWWYRRRHGFS